VKIAVGMIVFEGDYVLKNCLEQIYQYVDQILIAEGPVKYWQELGVLTSRDDTNKILEEFPDPDNKIIVTHGQYTEKDEQCRAYMKYVRDDIDYIWNIDSDEVYDDSAIQQIIKVLKNEQPTSVGIRSFSFYGGFNHYLTGFELNKDNFLRIFKYTPGSTWETHRPPTIRYPENIDRKHIDSEIMYYNHKVYMHHYSYVFPSQVKKKIGYYKECVSKDNCIDVYFNKIYIPWVRNPPGRLELETYYQGVHEFKPQLRGPCFTEKWLGSHPYCISMDMFDHGTRFGKEIAQWT